MLQGVFAPWETPRHVDPVTAFLAGSAFHPALTEKEADHLHATAVSRLYKPGACIRRKGMPTDGWLGLATGVVKIENTAANGRSTTLTNFYPGCWFGEGSLLRGGNWAFDAIALTEARIVLVPTDTFEWLLASNLAFNRFLLDQLNARLAQFVERCEHLRLHDIDHYVAHCLAEMIDPRFYPRSKGSLTMTQEALARLTGVSRSVVNRVLHRLEREGLLRIDYRSISLLDPDGLRRFRDA